MVVLLEWNCMVVFKGCSGLREGIIRCSHHE